MKIKEIIICFFLCLVVTLITGYMVFVKSENKDPFEVYQVYLDGKKLGLISSKEDLYNLINNEQKEIKETYDVDKVYPPTGLEIKKYTTYDERIISSNAIYNLIKDTEPFTINGYEIKIKSPVESETADNKSDKSDKPENVEYTEKKIYVLDKQIFEDSMNDFINVFIDENEYKAYIEDNQVEITDTGELIKNIYFEDIITIKKTNISTEEKIFTSDTELSQYLLYGSLAEQDKYTVETGDTISSIAFANKLNVEEFLIANPQYTNESNLLSPGQNVNIGLISPILTLTYELYKVEDLETDFETNVTYDYNLSVGVEKITQEGVKGLNRAAEKIFISNGETLSLEITSTTILRPSISKEVTKGGKKNYYVSGNIEISDDNGVWAWPTAKPYVISSYFAWRWGKMHEGLDISGCGDGSPIYAAGSGTVVSAGTGGVMGWKSGINVILSHPNGYYTVYAHLKNYAVKEGQVVEKGQRIGSMGRSGYVTGVHLHFGVYNGMPYHGGSVMNPLLLYR